MRWGGWNHVPLRCPYEPHPARRVVDERPTVEQYFMDMTHLVKSRGTCPRRKVGALVVKDKRVLTTGYNGAPRNFPHPCDTGCLREELGIPRGMMADVCPCLHAEQNAILQAATTGVSIEGAELYCTTQPCTQCSRMIANCGIRTVVFEEEYPDPMSVGLLVTAGVELLVWDAEARTVRPYGRTNTFEEAQDALRRRFREEGVPGVARPTVAVRPEDVATRGTRPEPVQAAGEAPPAGAAAQAVPEETADAHEESARGIRDLAQDPDAADKIRRLAEERVRREREAREQARSR